MILLETKIKHANQLTLVIGNNVVKIIAMDGEARWLRIGDKVVISSKAFNPILMPVR